MGDNIDTSGISNRATPYLEFHAVEAWLGTRQVFRNLSLSLYPGEHTVILGPNGSGKSSLIRLLSREMYPVVRQGSWLRMFGEETIHLGQLRSRIGLLTQEQHSTYRGDVLATDVVLSGCFGSVGLGRSHTPNQEQRQRVSTLLDQMGLAHVAWEPFANLSEGERRRLLLARALVHDPQVLVLDEPSNGLDLPARHQLLSRLGELGRGGTTLLMVTHRLEEILPEFSRAILLRGGEIVGDGATDSLLRDEPLSALFGTPLKVLEHGGYKQVFPA